MRRCPCAAVYRSDTLSGFAILPECVLKEQRFLFISDLRNNHIWFLNREDGKMPGQMGSMGENGGQLSDSI